MRAIHARPSWVWTNTQDMMLTGWRDGQIRSHDADTGQLLWSIDNAHARGVTSLVVSHNERFLVTGGLEGELRVWELRSRDLVSIRLPKCYSGVHKCRFLDAASLCGGSHDHIPAIITLANEKRETCCTRQFISYHLLLTINCAGEPLEAAWPASYIAGTVYRRCTCAVRVAR